MSRHKNAIKKMSRAQGSVASGLAALRELDVNLRNRVTMAGAQFDLDPSIFPNALEVNMGPEIKLAKTAQHVKLLNKKSNTKFDDPDYNPWDAIAKEMISGDMRAVEDAAQETERYLQWRESMGLGKETIRRKREQDALLIAASDELIAWLDTVGVKLEKIDTCSWHRFMEAVNKDMILTENAKPAEHITQFVLKDGAPQHFLVQHEWERLLSHATDEKGGSLKLEDFRLPFDRCSFEMKMSGRRIILIMHENPTTSLNIIILIECANGVWYVGNEYDYREVLRKQKEKYGVGLDFMIANIAAMCICIEANVIETEVIRAPHKLNASRAKQNKPPLPDHTVVSLSRRYRVSNPAETVARGEHAGKRMHFRRGHWRHYADHKTWIKWMLVGNPDLGFVEHEYRA